MADLLTLRYVILDSTLDQKLHVEEDVKITIAAEAFVDDLRNLILEEQRL